MLIASWYAEAAVVGVVLFFAVVLWKWRRRHPERWKAFVWATAFAFAILMGLQWTLDWLFPGGLFQSPPCDYIGCL